MSDQDILCTNKFIDIDDERYDNNDGTSLEDIYRSVYNFVYNDTNSYISSDDLKLEVSDEHLKEKKIYKIINKAENINTAIRYFLENEGLSQFLSKMTAMSLLYFLKKL